MCVRLYMHVRHTLVVYVHDADWLTYLHKDGHASMCPTVILAYL